jgi:glucose-1-phosphate cytidylyltransferase
VIKEYFANYFTHTSDITFDLKNNTTEIHQNTAEPWKVTVVDTGEETMTGGRLKRVAKYLGTQDFCFTYGDGVSDVNIRASIEFHKSHGKLSTITAVQPPGRYGALKMNGSKVEAFMEKPKGDGGVINGGFFVLNPKVIEYIKEDETIWEKEPMEKLASDGQMQAFVHDGFWQPMDTLRDKKHLEELWNEGKAPWKVW